MRFMYGGAFTAKRISSQLAGARSASLRSVPPRSFPTRPALDESTAAASARSGG
jgi:hypothetical protein